MLVSIPPPPHTHTHTHTHTPDRRYALVSTAIYEGAPAAVTSGNAMAAASIDESVTMLYSNVLELGDVNGGFGMSVQTAEACNHRLVLTCTHPCAAGTNAHIPPLPPPPNVPISHTCTHTQAPPDSNARVQPPFALVNFARYGRAMQWLRDDGAVWRHDPVRVGHGRWGRSGHPEHWLRGQVRAPCLPAWPRAHRLSCAGVSW